MSRRRPSGTAIGIAQIGQPALAAVWSYLLLGFVLLNQRVGHPPATVSSTTHGELAGSAG